MKQHLLALAVLASSLPVAGALATTAAPHLEMDLSGREYMRLLEKHQPDLRVVGSKERGSFDAILAMGKRFYNWLDLINKDRPAGRKLSLSSAATQHAYPIEAPRLSNPTIINNEYAALRAKLPGWLVAILLDGGQLTATVPVSDEEFAALGRQVTDVYERASRWVLEAPYLSQYAARKADDVRGYYYLGKEPNLQSELANFSTLDAGKQKQLSEWLVINCMDDDNSEAACKSELAGAQPTAFYQKYLKAAEKKWNSYFDITTHRYDITFTDPNQMDVPFTPPPTEALRAFLKDNIEDEWKFGSWQLRLVFDPSAAPHLEFEAGATPHVNDLAGDTITMDENAPLTEYDVQWTIRHEFGHVIGFPDCYLEFYDRDTSTMISYQLDITNLMCSRRGHLQQRHVDELKRVYFHG